MNGISDGQPEKTTDQQPSKIKVTLVRSVIGTMQAHRACVRGLGLHRLHQSVEVEDTPATRGMINKVRYLIKCEA